MTYLSDENNHENNAETDETAEVDVTRSGWGFSFGRSCVPFFSRNMEQGLI